MEDCCDQWHDRLLATDTSSKRESFSGCEIFDFIFLWKIVFGFQLSLLPFFLFF